MRPFPTPSVRPSLCKGPQGRAQSDFPFPLAWCHSYCSYSARSAAAKSAFELSTHTSSTRLPQSFCKRLSVCLNTLPLERDTLPLERGTESHLLSGLGLRCHVLEEVSPDDPWLKPFSGSLSLPLPCFFSRVLGANFIIWDNKARVLLSEIPR